MKCSHQENGEWLFTLTGAMVDGLNEYVCKACATVHLASKEEESMNTFFLQPLQKNMVEEDDKKKLLTDAMNVMFGEKVEVYQRLARYTAGSAQIHIPKRFAYTPVTVLVWIKEKDVEKYGSKLRRKHKSPGPFQFHPIYGDPAYKTRSDLVREVSYLRDALKASNPDHPLLNPESVLNEAKEPESKESSTVSESTVVNAPGEASSPETDSDLREPGLEERHEGQ